MKLTAAILLLFVLATGCACRSTMTMCDYEAVGIGEPIYKVVENAGEPLQVNHCGKGREQYIYVTHREPAAHQRALSRYVIVVENNIVVDKWIDYEEEELSLMEEQMTRDYGL
jgi:hypothetical protein